MPHDLASTIPRLQAAKTRACGRLRCGRCVDTVRSHCDNASGQDMIFLLMRYEISYVLSYQSIMSCCFFPLLFKNLPVKATQGSPPFFPATPAPTRRIRFPARFSKYLPLRDFLASLLTVGKRGSVVAGMDIKPEGSANVPGEAFSPTHAINSSIKKAPTHVNGLSRLHTRPLSQPA